MIASVEGGSTTQRSYSRAVVYLYTQTGQLREVTKALTDPLEGRDWSVRWVDVQPRKGFPFPWPVRRFFGVFPEAVDRSALVELVEPKDGFHTAADELVILAYQVWYLSPSIPIRSLLAAHPESVRDRDVVTVIACRNMWYSAAIEMCQLLRAAGARSVEVVAATDTRSSATTLVTTLRWLLTGNREPFLWFGRAGVGADELGRVAEVGRCLAEAEPRPSEMAPVVPALAVADILAGHAFRRWGALADRARAHGKAASAASLTAFVLVLLAAIALGLPLAATAEVLGGARLAARIRGLVYRQILFGHTAFRGTERPLRSLSTL
ncbi:hypothetical protein MSAS_18750 [Mycobacterium saskatchewanense]|uniref:Dialkylrecorsinol condensing protein DarA n=1 Tax=Mycobacterium saskatchewanense TaxID=220927 RepID=A0AAJ3NPG4_9MYCO|nr:hypothetical protein [Mycobacterium saskatchewanense]ORW71125.1 hypothetical protein AWC23_01005 [Mycobacterium saskatchewanense]BBX62701.1 hypothetical protein MSAS_18750 [Mycobacterium saskatchewanense]